MATTNTAEAHRGRVGAWPMWLLGFVIMIDQVDQSLVRGLTTELKSPTRGLGLSDVQIGVLLSCFVLVNGVITVPAGYLADRWMRTRTIGHTVIGWSVITALSGAFANFGWLVSIRSFLGFGQAITEPSAASLLGDYYEPDRRGRAFSIQQVLLLAGQGVGLGLGGQLGKAIGWRQTFLVVGLPGILLAFVVYRLREPKRGEADRAQMGLAVEDMVDEEHELFDDGLGAFIRSLAEGLVQDARTILRITTMRYALVGVSALLFSITAVGVALPQFYERQLHRAPGTAETLVGALLVFGGIPGVLAGGWFADRFQNRVRGARMAIPAYCLLTGNALFVGSYVPRLPFAAVFALELVGVFAVCMAIPALRAGLTDAVPHNLRGAGFGFFNLASVIFGAAAAPLIVFVLSGIFDGNLRTALIIVSPPVFVGAFFLLRARNHLDDDAAKIFMAIAEAMQAQQAEEAARAAAHAPVEAPAAAAPSAPAAPEPGDDTSSG
jgi:MFS family permease